MNNILKNLVLIEPTVSCEQCSERTKLVLEL